MVDISPSTPRLARPCWIAVAAFFAFALLVPGIALGFEPVSHGHFEILAHPRDEVLGPMDAEDPGLMVVPEPATGLLFGFGLLILGS